MDTGMHQRQDHEFAFTPPARHRRCARAWATAAALAALTALAACGGDGDPPASAPRELPLDRLSIAAPVGGKEPVTVQPEVDADEGPYTVSTSDARCATAETVGVGTVQVKGVAVGSCSVTIRSAGGAAMTLPVEVYDPFVLDNGELVLTYTNQFVEVGQEIILGGVIFYQPLPPDGFTAFGTAIVDREHGEAVANKVVFVVKAKNATAMVPTHAYEFVRRIASVSYYRPICPAGYKALGTVVNVPEPVAASPLATACIREDLTTLGRNSRAIGVGFGSSAGAVFWWGVDPPLDPALSNVDLAPGTFLAGFPWPAETAAVLSVKLPVVADVPRRAWRPRLTSNLCPPPGWETRPVLTRTLLVPFTHIVGPAGMSAPVRAATSPFYRLERFVNFKMMACRYNDTSLEQPAAFTFTRGITRSESQAFETRTGVEVTFEAGITLKDLFNAGVTTKLSLEFGYTRTTEVSELQQEEGTFSFDAVPQATTAIFQDHTVFRVYQHAGDRTDLVGTTPPLHGMSFVVTQYPPPR